MRVGDYKFDNTNFAGGGFGAARATTWSGFPLDNSYPVLRRYLWLETDSAYKAAVEAISRKRAALRNVTQSEQLNDFAHAEPVRLRAAHSAAWPSTKRHWANRVRALSAIFAQYPEREELAAWNWKPARAATTW